MRSDRVEYVEIHYGCWFRKCGPQLRQGRLKRRSDGEQADCRCHREHEMESIAWHLNHRISHKEITSTTP